MSETQSIQCIVCPIGCEILVKKNGRNVEILEGCKCKRGKEYAYSEALDPRRMLTTSVKTVHGAWPLVSVKSSKPVPKDKIPGVLTEIKKHAISAPIKRGDIIIPRILGTDIDIIATKTITKTE